MTSAPHPFSRFTQILGRGKTLTRSLTVEEAEEAMGMILRGEVLDAQLGAFLMLLRVKEETAEEIAGFVKACRKSMDVPPLSVDIDWSSYAGKKRQLPWFILSALLMARDGFRVFMHGAEGHTAGRLYTRETLLQLGIPVASTFAEAAAQIEKTNFAYMTLVDVIPKLAEMIGLRNILGLRSPVHTLSRKLNPFGAPCMLQGVFHPGYMDIHQKAGLILGQPHMAVFRGEGGEIERRPNKPTEVKTLHNGVLDEERWPAIIPEPRQTPEEDMDIGRLVALWKGDIADEYAEAAIAGTVAIALKTCGKAASFEEAQATAEAMWQSRDRSRLAA
jgi:anthranilate phosphoribosyltransferase